MPEAAEFYDFFVSYSRTDNANGWISGFIEELLSEHQKFTGGRTLRCFFDTESNRTFDDWQHRIYGGLAASSLFVAFVSPNYFTGEWCRREWKTWIDIEIAKHILSGGIAPIYIIEVPGLLGESGKPLLGEQEVAQSIAELCGLPALHQEFLDSAAPVVRQLRRRQFNAVQPFYTAGIEALRQADLRTVLESLGKEIDDRVELVRQSAASKTTVPPYNRRFVGRLEELTLLRERLHQGRTGVISGHKSDLPEDKSLIASVQGLGGIGKTELAFTYAHAFAGLYPGGRFLVPCDGRSDLRQAMLALDEIFRAEITDEQRKTLDLHFGAIRDCLRRRLHEMGRILLVLDNVTDAALLSPEQTDTVRALGPDLHLLATTRLGAPEGGGTFDDVHWLTLGELSFEDSLRLLEKHRDFATPEERAAAESIARRLRGFALCVEVVGAYLGQHPEQSYAQFLATMGLEDLAPVDLAAERHDVVTRRHNNEKRLRAILDHTLRELAPEAMSALHFASLLPPDHIVLPWLSKLVGDVHPAFATDATAWQRLIARLVSLALLTRGEDGEAQALDESHQPRVFRCHRLLQDYLRGKSNALEKAQQQKAVDALVENRIGKLSRTTVWEEARWELEPLTVLAMLWDEANHPEAAGLLNNVGERWTHLAQFSLAEPLIRRALAIYEQGHGCEHQHVAGALTNLAFLLKSTNRYGEAEPLYRMALTIDTTFLGREHPDVARDLNNLGRLLQDTNRLVEAEDFFRRALAIWEKNHGADHPAVALVLSNLAQILQTTNRSAEAESLLRHALAIDERSLGPEHPDVANDLNELAQVLQSTNRMEEAEPLYRRALEIWVQSFGPDHPRVAAALNNLASVLKSTNRVREAEPLFRRSAAILENVYGPEHPQVGTALNGLAGILQDTNRLEEAEPINRQVVHIFEKSFGPDHPSVATAINNLAVLLERTPRFAEAEPLYRRALAIDEASFGPEHPDVARDLDNLADLLRATNRPDEAEPLFRRSLAIRENCFGPDHPILANVLNNLAVLMQAANRLKEAEPLQRRTLIILAKFMATTRHQHPHFDKAMQNYGDTLMACGWTQQQATERVRSALEEGGLSLGG